ncbi:MAG: HesB/IscA family protein, partial [Chitinophagales bacterium]
MKKLLFIKTAQAMDVGLENSIYISDKAKAKVQQLMQDAGVGSDPSYFLRVGVVGGGCSGFSYSMSFENGAGMMDKTFDFEGLKVYVDATSLMYLKGVNVDYIETLE